MLNLKKIIALNVLFFATLVCIAKWHSNCSQNLCDQEAINAAASFSKADDFSIVNLLSLKFR